MLLWGDSTAAHYYEALIKLFPRVTILQANMSSCPPIVGFDLPNLINCSSFNDMVLARAVSTRPDLVILSAIWPYDNDALSKLDATLRTLQTAGVRVAIIGRSPIYNDTVPNILARRMMHGDHNIRGGNDGSGSSYWGDHYMKARYSALSGVRYISFQDIVCKESDCSLLTGSGVPAWWDNYHLTLDGAIPAVKRMFPEGLPSDASH